MEQTLPCRFPSHVFFPLSVHVIVEVEVHKLKLSGSVLCRSDGVCWFSRSYPLDSFLFASENSLRSGKVLP